MRYYQSKMNPWLWILVILAVISLIVVIVVTARLEKKEKERQESFISKSNPWKVLSKELDVVGLRKTTNISTDINEISEIDNGTLTFKDIYFSNPDGLNGIYYNYNDSTIVKNIVFDHCIIETNDMSKFVKCFTKNESNLVSFDGSTSVFLSVSFDDMFNGYNNLKNVYIGSAPITISAKRMFKGCTSLKDKLINIIRSQLGFKCLIDATSMFEGVQLWAGSFDTHSNEWMSSIKYADRMFANDTKITYNTSIYRVAYSIESGKEMFKGYNLNTITFDYSNDRTNFYHAVDSANTITFTGNVRIHDEEQLDVCVDWSKVKQMDFEGLNSALNDDGRSIHPFIIDTSNLKVMFYGDLLIYDSESKQIQWNSKGGPSLIVKSETIGEGDCKFEAQYPMIFERDSVHAELYKQIGYSDRIDEIKWCYVLGLEDKVEFNGVHFIDCNSCISNPFHPNIESISIIDCTFDKPIEWDKVFKNHKSLISVRLDFDSDIETMDEMFSGCSKLERVDISSRFMSNVLSMNNVFSGCTELKNIKWSPNEFNHISLKGAFYGCHSLNKLPMENILIGDCEEMANNTYIADLTINIDSKSNLSKLLNGNTRLKELHLRGNSVINSFGELYNWNEVPQSFEYIDFGDMYIDNNPGVLFTGSTTIESIRYLPNPIDGKSIFRIVGGKLYWNGTSHDLPTTKIIEKIDSKDGYITIKFDKYTNPREIKPSKWYYGDSSKLKITNTIFDGSNDRGFEKITDDIKYIEFVECTFVECTFENLFSYSDIELVVFIGGTFNECDFTKAFYNCQSLRSVVFDDTRFINCNKMASMFEEDDNLIEVIGMKFEIENIDASRLFYNCSNLMKTNKFNFNLNDCNFSYMFYGCTRLWFDEDIEIEIANSNYQGLFMKTNIRSLTIVANGFKLESNSYIRDIASGKRLRMIDFGDLITNRGITGDLSMYVEDIEDIFKNGNPYGINGEPIDDIKKVYSESKILSEIGYTPLIIKWHTIHSINKTNGQFETNQIFKIKYLTLDWNSMKTTIDNLESNLRSIPQGYSIKDKFAIVRSDEPSCGMFPNSDKMEFDNIVVISNSNITIDCRPLYSNYKFIEPDKYRKFTTNRPIDPILIFAKHDFYNFQYLVDYQYFDESNPIYKLQCMIFDDDITNYNTDNSKHLTEEEIKSVYSCITPEELKIDIDETRLEVAKGILDEFYKNVDYCY